MLKYIILVFSLSSSLLSEEKKFDDYEYIEKIFQAYIKAVDEKNIDEMSKQFENSKAVMVTHYQGLTMPQIDELRSKMREHGIIFIQRLDKINIAPRYDWIDEKVCTVDVTYSRLGEDDEFIVQKRSIYHFYRDKNSGIFGFFRKWKKWKIYMLVDTEVESAQS